jgi:hypothetical protein
VIASRSTTPPEPITRKLAQATDKKRHRGTTETTGKQEISDRVAPPLLWTSLPTLAEIHDRLPLMLAEGDWDAWLNLDAPLDSSCSNRPSRSPNR